MHHYQVVHVVFTKFVITYQTFFLFKSDIFKYSRKCLQQELQPLSSSAYCFHKVCDRTSDVLSLEKLYMSVFLIMPSMGVASIIMK